MTATSALDLYRVNEFMSSAHAQLIQARHELGAGRPIELVVLIPDIIDDLKKALAIVEADPEIVARIEQKLQKEMGKA